MRKTSQKTAYFQGLPEIVGSSNQQVLGWLEKNPADMTIKITDLPKRDEVEDDINEQLIVEYYSR